MESVRKPSKKIKNDILLSDAVAGDQKTDKKIDEKADKKIEEKKQVDYW